ncbi:MAG: hypothetical protein ABFD69_02440 [Candidatus Sumerlaeia bacterium]
MQWRILVFVLAMLPALAGAQGAVSVKLAFNPDANGAAGNKNLTVSLRPGGGYKLPDLNTTTPLYASIDLADGRRLLIFDRARKKGEYSRLIADCNGNGNLADDTPLSGTQSGFGGKIYFMQFPKVPFEVKQDGRASKAMFAVSLMVFDEKTEPTSATLEYYEASVSSCGGHTGTFKLGGRDYELTLADSNLDGLPGSPFKRLDYNKYMDRELIDPDGDNLNITDKAKKEFYLVPLCRRILIDGKMYGLAFDPKQSTMTFTPQDAADFVPLGIGRGIDHVALVNETGSDSIAMIEPRETETVPADRWRPVMYSSEFIDKGLQWNLQARSTKSTPFVDAREKGARLALAESFTPRIVLEDEPEAVCDQIRKNNRVSLGYALGGNNGEIVLRCVYMPMRRGLFDALTGSSGMKQPPAPTFEISTADGKKVTSGSFQYG